MSATIIVAKDYPAAHAYAREVLGLPKNSYRIAFSAASLKGLPSNMEVHLVPGWETRYDRFAIKSNLRFSKATVIEGGEVQPQREPKDRPVKRGPGRPRKQA